MDKEILAKIKPGAMVQISERIPAESGSASGGKKGGKERVSNFKGVILARKHGKETGATFTVLATVGGVNVEKIYPVYSPIIAKVKILSSPKKVHRSKPYFLRKISKKKSREKIGVAA